MARNNHPVGPEELMAYLDGELPPDRAVSAAAHVERCPECQQLAGDLQGVSRKLMAWEVASSGAGIAPRVAAAFEEPTRQRSGARRLPAWEWGLAAACLLLAVFTFSGPPFRTYRLAGQRGVSVDLYRARGPAESAPPAPPQDIGRAGPKTYAGGITAPPAPRLADHPAQPPAAPMIARTAALTLVVADFDQARAAIEAILSRHLGYFADLNVSAPSGAGRAISATLRVPADQLEASLAEFRKLGRVETESQNGEEVTAQYVDLEARLANARNTAQRLTDLLRERTGKLADVLAVETELDRVRGEIESMEAQRKSLSSRVEFASVNVTVREDFKAQLQPLPDSTWNRFRNAAIQGYRSMADSLVDLLLFLISVGPTFLLWGGLLFFPARFAWRKWRPGRTT